MVSSPSVGSTERPTAVRPDQVLSTPPAGGFLTGKYAREDTRDTGRLSGANPFGESKFADRNWQILDVLKDVAAELGRPAAQVALAWVMGRPGVDATTVGASRLVQLEGHIAAAALVLGEEHQKRLDEASAPIPVSAPVWQCQ